LDDLKGNNENAEGDKEDDDKKNNDENKIDVDKDNFTGEQSKMDKTEEMNKDEEEPEGN